MKFLIIDDNPSDRELVTRELRKEFPEAEFEEIIRRADFDKLLSKSDFDVVITDYRLHWTDGLWILQQIRERYPGLPIVMATDSGGEEVAVEGMKHGLSDYVLKRNLRRLPIAVKESIEKAQLREKHDEAIRRLRAAETLLRRQNAALKQAVREKYRFERIIGDSDEFMEVLKKAEQVALTSSTVLIYGETGTGKELLARAIHQSSPRSLRNFVPINCGAIPGELLESELFGHERGAFTGAVSRRIGRLEEADGGTLFLDEIGDMPLNLQVKLLRVLQEGVIQRLGSNQDVAVDVRVIAATHEDLTRLVADGKFREDLYYRLKVFELEIPPLRERREDVPLLIKHFIANHGEKLGKQIVEIDAVAYDALHSYDYPGNVRELEHIIERAMILCEGDVITADVLPREVKASADKKKAGGAHPPLSPSTRLAPRTFRVEDISVPRNNEELKAAKAEAQRKIELLFLMDLLSSTRGNVSEAARKAEMNRYWLMELIRKHQLDLNQFKGVV